MDTNRLADYCRYYLDELKSGDRENAFHSLIEADPAVVPILIEEFGRDTDASFRTEVMKIIAEFGMPETVPFFEECLHDEFWKTALDCLVMQSSLEAIGALERGRERKFDTDKDTNNFHEWLEEAIKQARK
ncbi:MAG: HEAT repeat domain-containing protein [Chthoniobacteraceae bacterium]